MVANTDTLPASPWQTIPQELQALKQWLVAAPANHPQHPKRPMMFSSFNTLVWASINNPECYMTFERATELAAAYSAREGAAYGIGLVLTADDPYVIIDLDDKTDNPATDEERRMFGAMLHTFDTYAETSASGTGVHIIVRANVTTNFHRGHVECYSSKRFMVMTGNSLTTPPKAIAEYTATIETMTSQMLVADKADEIEIDDAGRETNTDAEVAAAAYASVNGEKFGNLVNGHYEQYFGGNSQSEADGSLMQFLWFHSRNKAQCIRMFLETALGQRAKAHRKDYLPRTLAHAMGRLASDEALQSAVSFDELFVGLRPPTAPPDIVLPPPMPAALPAPPGAPLVDLSGLLGNLRNSKAPDTIVPPMDKRERSSHVIKDVPLPQPMGKMVALVEYFKGASSNPTNEMAMAAAVGTLAGIAGCSYQTPGQATGLNQYFVLIAKSGTGKESMKQGIQHLIRACGQDGKFALQHHFNFTEYGSWQALLAQGILKAPTNSFLHVSSEWGMKMQAMGGAGNAANAAGYQTIQLQMYTASAAGAIVSGHMLQNKENAAQDRGALAYSILSETNPHSFAATFTTASSENGFLSRITAMEYPGIMPDVNRDVVSKPSAEVVRDIVLLASQAKTIAETIPSGALLVDGQRPVGVHTVGATEEAWRLLDEHREHEMNVVRAYQSVDNGPEDLRQHLHTRANLKVLRLACLVAAYENPIQPIVVPEMVTWAIQFINHSMNVFNSRYATGEMGDGSGKGVSKLLYTLRQYATGAYDAAKDVDIGFRESHIIQRTNLSLRMGRFLTDSMPNSRNALDDVLIEACKSGYLVKLSDKDKAAINVRSECYRIVSLGD